jgi:hypothetical protein
LLLFKVEIQIPQRKKDNLHPFLQANPDVCSAVQQYGKENLRELSIEMMVEYVHRTIIPPMIVEEKKVPVKEVRGDEERYKEKILRQYGLTSICSLTVYKWM